MSRMNHQTSLCLCVFMACTAALSAPVPKPGWAEVECPRRAAFAVGKSTAQTLLVNIPLEAGDEGVGRLAAYGADGGRIPFRLVYDGAEQASVLVRLGERKTGVAGHVYYGGEAEKNGAGGPVGESITDSAPLRAEVRKARGLGIPDTWSRMLFMFHQAGKTYRVTWADSFGELKLARESDSESLRKTWRVGRYMTRMTTYVLFPETGVYRMALNCKNAGFLLLDGEMAASWPGEHYFGSWHPGAPVFAKAGVHKLEVFNCTVGYPYIHVGWQLPGREKVSHITRGALLSGQESAFVRVERQDRSLHPHFTYDVQPAYAFRNHPAVFVPVAFANTSEDWVSEEMTCRWLFDGAAPAEGSAATHVFLGAGRHRAKLEVRDALGYRGTHERVVDCRLAQPMEYALFAEPSSLPAVAYATDTIEPNIDIAGVLPGEGKVRLEWIVARSDRTEETGHKVLVPTNQTVSVPVTRAVVGELEHIRWSVTHRGVDILTGQVRFLRAPFKEAPARVRGDSFYDRSGARLVLIPHQHAGVFTQPATATEAPRHIQCIDDGLAVPGLPNAEEKAAFHRVLLREIPGKEVPRVEYIPLRAWQDEHGGYAPLMKITRVAEAIHPGADLAVLSIGLQDLLGARDVDMFERHAAALSDLVAGTLGRRVVWVTPPPYPPDPATARPFAAAIKKVAGARGIPVADLFTAFSGAEDDITAFFDNDTITLSKRGHALAAHVILRALQQ